ncbi:hypothetical protein Ahy_A09g041914 [Arachis hypogaea]|uniref:Uncharacterized protein n=1 Tax=Arachis hypogaea TaxID=3818 RepID=A0A445BE78_ARAHY|nr:hypothetical protein Ahy_A09g041914 [Arachis hypogaea]
MKRRRFTLTTSLPQRFHNVLSPSSLHTKQTQHRVWFLLLPPSISNGACAPPLTGPISAEDVGSGASLLSSPSYTKLGSIVSLKKGLITTGFRSGLAKQNCRVGVHEEALSIFKRRLLGVLLEFSAQELQVQPIITLLEEVRMYAMRSIARNKVKLNSNTGVLPPIQRSRLEKIRKESKNWVPM